MRKCLFILLLMPVLVKAQYCGNSGPAVCTPVYYAPDTNKVSDIEFDSLPCVVRGVHYNESVSTRTDSVCFIFGSQYGCIDINSYEIDSMWGLPAGICWATNDMDNTVYSGQWLCVNFSGITYAAPGAYLVSIERYTSVDIPTNGIQEPHKFYLRVIEPGAPCQATVVYNDVSTVEDELPPIKLVGDKLILENTAAQSVISIYDLTGRLLKQTTIQYSTHELNVSDIHGVFLVNFASKGGSHTQKFAR